MPKASLRAKEYSTTLKVRRRRRRSDGNEMGSFFSLNNVLQGKTPKPEESQTSVIRAESPEIVGPVSKLGDLKDFSSLGGFTPKDFVFQAKSENEEYADERFFGLRMVRDGWEVHGRWVARGIGKVPTGVAMAANMASLFNMVFNMLVGQFDLEQQIFVHKGQEIKNPFALGFAEDEDDRDV